MTNEKSERTLSVKRLLERVEELEKGMKVLFDVRDFQEYSFPAVGDLTVGVPDPAYKRTSERERDYSAQGYINNNLRRLEDRIKTMSDTVDFVFKELSSRQDQYSHCIRTVRQLSDRMKVLEGSPDKPKKKEK